jgi:putrescine aminotransferase
MRTPNLVPDILCYAKSFGGGKASISGITAKEKIYTSAYDNPDDVMLQSTTYYGFGEECITAIEALQIIVDDDYVSKSKMLEQSFSKMLNELKTNFPEEISFIRGAGALWALKLGKPSSDRILNLLRQITPYRGDTKLIEKLTAAAVIDYCYREHGILLFMSANQDTLLKISFPLIATQAEVDIVQRALNYCFSIGLDKVLFDFLMQNLKQKLTGL